MLYKVVGVKFCQLLLKISTSRQLQEGRLSVGDDGVKGCLAKGGVFFWQG